VSRSGLWKGGGEVDPKGNEITKGGLQHAGRQLSRVCREHGGGRDSFNKKEGGGGSGGRKSLRISFPIHLELHSPKLLELSDARDQNSLTKGRSVKKRGADVGRITRPSESFAEDNGPPGKLPRQEDPRLS